MAKSKKKKCIYCNYMNKKNAKFCVFCTRPICDQDIKFFYTDKKRADYDAHW